MLNLTFSSIWHVTNFSYLSQSFPPIHLPITSYLSSHSYFLLLSSLFFSVLYAFFLPIFPLSLYSMSSGVFSTLTTVFFLLIHICLLLLPSSSRFIFSYLLHCSTMPSSRLPASLSHLSVPFLVASCLSVLLQYVPPPRVVPWPYYPNKYLLLFRLIYC